MASTEIKLPNKLKNRYKGTNKSNPAVLKMNILIELLDYSFKNTVLSAGNKIEQNFSKYVYDKLVTDSLVLKDLGYFKFDDFNEIESRNSFFVSRLRAGTRLFALNPNPRYSPKGKLLKKTKYLVTNVGELGEKLKAGETQEYEFLVGSPEDKRPFRVILTKLDEESSSKKIERIETHIYATLIKMFLLMEITKGINGVYSKEISIRRVIKNSLGFWIISWKL